MSEIRTMINADAEAVFAAWEAHTGLKLNPHTRKVTQVVHDQTGIPIAQILDDSLIDDIVYARHLVRYAMVEVMSYTPSNVSRMMGWARTSVSNSVAYIRNHIGKHKRIAADVAALQKNI